MPQDNVPKNLTVQQLFDQALSAQQQKKGDEALKLYQETLDIGQSELTSPQISVIFHNMSTIAYEKSDYLHAYVWSKKSLAMDSGNHMAQQAYEQYVKKFEIPTVAHQISTSQNIQKFLTKIPLDLMCVFCLILMFLTLRLFFKNLLARRQNQIDIIIIKSFAWKPLALSILLLLTLVLTGLRLSIDQKTHAIIMTDKTGIQTAAGENKSVIYEAQSGLEVEVLAFSEGYVQIRYPGAFSGWVSAKNIEILTDILNHK